MRRPPPPAPSSPPVQPVVLGGDIGAYSLARAAHEAYGVRTVVVSSAATGPVRRSRVVDHVVVPGVDAPEVAVAALHRVADEHAASGSGAPLLLLGSADRAVRLLVEQRAHLEDRFVLPYVGRELLDRMTDKEGFGAVCAELGIPSPRTVVVDVQRDARATGGPGVDVGRTVGGGAPLTFPVIAKAASTTAYAGVSFPGKQKVFTVRDAVELDDLVDVLARAGYRGTFLVQDLVPGDDSGMRILTCYSDRSARVRFSSFGRVLLEEHTPGALGNPAGIVTGGGAEVAEQARRLLEHVGWTGYANFDLKVDPRDGRAVFFELNPRLGRSNYYVTASGRNPVELYVREHLQGLDPLPPGAPELADAERLYTVLPPALLLRYVADPALRAHVRGLVRSGRAVDPLRYGPERDPRRLAYVAAAHLNQVRKYRRHYPLERAREIRAEAEELVRRGAA
ncbi:hypothetical protein [uncultured Pseudokineococcus sp.]|uniref:carboxylate--amine ligase n=1 Tax=uncultured Pseudokineococcus sp. TaxID=1642928 RepID=UPI00261C80FE|nr:hypothetical protein [uncultured Pseudokineococcus sp.]